MSEPALELLRPDHAPALLAFERENRAYFSASIPDRGDDYFTGFDARHAELLAEQGAGLHFFHVLVDSDGAVLGRINLVDVANRSAVLGYRIAEKAARQGLATRAVHRTCALASDRYGLSTLRAATTLDNEGSRTVLARTGFVPTGETLLSGRPGTRYVRHLDRDPAALDI
ncbi:GNAT family N-acetyltransferase [Streptomyces sp. AK02-01A]|uniref:GNAT family N-acetyltransferase n=1 Tax=Streptomyces sp. AK02-01A TaxID=3028648 RepID=UPI0029B93FB9|nr:GNAT family N-acetyltransferase [Streptomyces sp. AK02-01A]MDX3853738.1 GNAT family N-acetyltransferase [Streptomyces sp. AK02-01A]